MKVYSVPGINGLDKTLGVEKNSKRVFESTDFEEVKLDNEDIEKQLDQIYSVAKEFVKEKFFVLGGDHSISFPIAKAFFENYGEDAKLLVFDAHPDLIEPMPEPGHEEWLRAVVQLGFKPENIILVGVRRESENIDDREDKYANEEEIRIIYLDEFEERREEIIEFVSGGKVYCSFDIDAFDSSLIKSTGYVEDNGLMEDEVFELLGDVKENIFGFDLVEINLEKGSEEDKKETLRVGRKLLKTVAGKE
ncbi:hypothetical protein HOD29_00350 [archaeon]|nr:hypothetical protein [archaeon]